MFCVGGFLSDKLLESINDTAEAKGQIVWVLVDETEGLLSMAGIDPTLLHRFRGTLQNCPALRAVLVAGKTLSETDKLRSEGMSPFFSGFDLRYLGYLTPTAAEALIRQRQSELPVEAEDDLVAALIECTGGHPLLLQLLCRELFDGGHLRPPQDQDMDEVMTQVRHMGIFDADFQYLSDAERLLLRAVSEAGRATAADLASIADAGFIHGLTKLGYLRQVGDDYAIGNEFLARWLPSAPWDVKSDITDEGTLRVYRRTALFETIVQHFDLEDLRTLCFKLGINYDDLRGEGREAQARELVTYMERRGELDGLAAEMRRQTKRP